MGKLAIQRIATPLVILCATGMLLGDCALSQAAEVARGVEYGQGLTVAGSKALLLDIYQPEAACQAPRATVVLIHGGGFRGGARDQSRWPEFAEDLANKGYVAVSIDYRLEGDEPVPSDLFAAIGERGKDSGFLGDDIPDVQINAAVSAFEDATSAMNWIVDNADTYCIDPGRLGLWGSSAGAITALQLAYSMDDFSIAVPPVLAVVALAGALIFDEHLEAGEPPVLVVHGTNDTVVPYKESLELQARAQAVGVPMVFHAVEGGEHGSIDINTLEVEGIVLIDRIYAFLDGALTSDVETRVAATRSAGGPTEFQLRQNRPNPFNSDTIIDFILSVSGPVDLAVFNLAGQRLAALVDGHREAGTYEVAWDGRSDRGRPLASGVYIYRLRTEKQLAIRKLLLLR